MVLPANKNLCAVFEEHASPELQQEALQWRSLAKLLESLYQHAAEDSGLHASALTATEFIARLAQVVPDTSDTLEARLRSIHLGPLYLTTACAKGDEGAIAHCDKNYFPSLSVHLTRFRSVLPLDEALQTLRCRLFVPNGGCPGKISGYTGRGKLESWLRVVAIRTTISTLRPKAPNTWDDSKLETLPDTNAQDEVKHIALKRHREELQECFDQACRELSVRERTILRLQYLDGLTIDDLSAMYGVHRSTVARWIVHIREKLQDTTKALLGDALEANEQEIESMMRLLQSQLDISIRRVLGHTAAEH